MAARVRALVGAPDESTEPIVQAPVLKVFGDEPRDDDAPSRAVQHDGFNLHANVAFEAHERVAVERLCRYMLRGPLASGRLRRGRADKLIYDLAHPRADGTTQLVLSPMALLQRLSWLCVLPHVHTTRLTITGFSRQPIRGARSSCPSRRSRACRPSGVAPPGG